MARHHGGLVTPCLPLPAKVRGGIIGSTAIVGGSRPTGADDVVFEYGDLREWAVVPCRRFTPADLPLDDLLDVIGMPNARGLNLWAMPSEVGVRLADRMGVPA